MAKVEIPKSISPSAPQMDRLGRIKAGCRKEYGEDTKYKDTVGSILGGLVNAEGGWDVVCKVGGLTEIQRDFFRDNTDYFIGKVFTAHGYCFYPSGAIRHPKFKVFRKDKDSEECTFEQIPESYSIKASPSGKTTEAFERDHRMASSRITIAEWATTESKPSKGVIP